MAEKVRKGTYSPYLFQNIDEIIKQHSENLWPIITRKNITLLKDIHSEVNSSMISQTVKIPLVFSKNGCKKIPQKKLFKCDSYMLDISLRNCDHYGKLTLCQIRPCQIFNTACECNMIDFITYVIKIPEPSRCTLVKNGTEKKILLPKMAKILLPLNDTLACEFNLKIDSTKDNTIHDSKFSIFSNFSIIESGVLNYEVENDTDFEKLTKNLTEETKFFDTNYIHVHKHTIKWGISSISSVAFIIILISIFCIIKRKKNLSISCNFCRSTKSENGVDMADKDLFTANK